MSGDRSPFADRTIGRRLTGARSLLDFPNSAGLLADGCSLEAPLGWFDRGDRRIVAVMDIGTLQWRLGWLGRLSRIDVRLAGGIGIDQLIATNRLDLPQAFGWWK